MHFRPFRSLSVAAASSFLLLGLASSASAAGEKDKEAQKLHDQAINEDYLNADFPKAAAKLKDALKKCGASGCTPSLVAKIHVSLGTIYGAGMSKLDDAKEEFILGLKADPAVTVDSALTNPDLDKAFAEAKKSAGSGTAGSTGVGTAGGKKPPSSDGDSGTHKAPPEQTVNTPVPIYMEPSDEQPTSKVTLRYKPFGSKTYKSVELKKMGKGFGGEIPCDDVTTTGDIKYFFALTDESGEAAGTLGTTKDPYKVTIKSEIEGEPPTLPGQKPPDQCKEKVDCPPGLPGCPAAGSGGGGGKRGDKGWGASCEETQQCSAGLVCLNGACEEGKDDGGGEGGKPAKKAKRNLASFGIQLDELVIGGSDNVCSPEVAGSYACFYNDGARKGGQFDGMIAKQPNTNGIQGGLGTADVRLLLGYERQLVAKLPLTLGVRLGWAFGGSPSPNNVQANGLLANKQPPANSFLGFHGEARATYYFLGFFEEKKVRPYGFLGGGIAQVNASVPVQVCDSSKNAAGFVCTKANAPSKATNVDAYQITGLNFFGFGAGAVYGITPSFGISFEAKFMVMLPTSGFVIAPTLSPVFAF